MAEDVSRQKRVDTGCIIVQAMNQLMTVVRILLIGSCPESRCIKWNLSFIRQFMASSTSYLYELNQVCVHEDYERILSMTAPCLFT